MCRGRRQVRDGKKNGVWLVADPPLRALKNRALSRAVDAEASRRRARRDERSDARGATDVVLLLELREGVTSHRAEREPTFRERDRFFIHGPSTSHRPHPRRVTTRHFFSMDRLRFLRLVCVLALGTPRCVHFASLHAARHRTNRSTRAYLRGDLAMVRATKPARASPRAFAKRAAVDSRFLSLSAFSRREVTKNPKRASTGPSSRGETRARRNESARVPRVPAPRARHSRLLDHASRLPDRSPPTESRPNATTRRNLAMTRTLFEHARSLKIK